MDVLLVSVILLSALAFGFAYLMCPKNGVCISMTLSRVIIIALFVFVANAMKFPLYVCATFFGIWVLFEVLLFVRRGIHSERYKMVMSFITMLIAIALQYSH